MDPLLFPWLAEMGIISYRTFRLDKRPPLPSELVSSFVIFGAFTVVSLWDRRVGAGLGWALVVATGLSLYDPTANSVNAAVQAPGSTVNPTGSQTPKKGQTT